MEFTSFSLPVNPFHSSILNELNDINYDINYKGAKRLDTGFFHLGSPLLVT